MKFKIPFSIIVLIFSLYSCNTIIKESEAITKNDLGLKYLNNGQIDLAIIEFRNAAYLTSSKDLKTQYLRNLAVAFHEYGELDSSRFYSLKAGNLHDKNSIDYLINIADVNMIDGEINEAISKLEKAIKKGGVGLETYNSLGLIYYGHYGLEYQNLDKAIIYNKKAYEINHDRTTEDLLARTYYEADKLDKAEYHFLRLKTNFPDILDYGYYLGLIKYESGELNEAKVILKQVVQKDSLYYFGIEHILEEE